MGAAQSAMSKAGAIPCRAEGCSLPPGLVRFNEKGSHRQEQKQNCRQV